jgi:hypothetical protein
MKIKLLAFNTKKKLRCTMLWKKRNVRFACLLLLFFLYVFICAPHKVINTVVSHVSMTNLHFIATTLAEPGSGEDVLPEIVQEVCSVIRDHKLENYKVSDKLVSKKWYFQQIIASSWPVQYSDHSKNVFYRTSEKPPAAYRARENFKHVFLCTMD